MYVRNEGFNGITYIDKKMDKILKENKAIKKVKIKNILFTILDLPVAYQIMLDDLKKDSKIIYPKTINV